MCGSINMTGSWRGGGERVVLLAPGCTASLRETDSGGLAFGHLGGNSFEHERFVDANNS